MSDAETRWRPAGNCALFVCDVVSFGDASRTDDVRTHMRAALYRRLEVSFEDAGISFAGCYREDRGDGVLVAVPPEVPADLLLAPVADMLKAELRRYNKTAADIARIRLRVAVNTGEAHWDGNGLVGSAVNHTFRILEEPRFKEMLRDSGASLALIVSRGVYEDVVRHGQGRADPDDYQRIDVSVKETETAAWVRIMGPAARPGGAVGPVSAPEHVPGAAQTAVAEATRTAAPAAELDRMARFEVVDRMLDVAIMAREQGRDEVVRALRREIAGAVPRHPEARLDCYSIISTCLDYPGGMRELLDVLRGFAGGSMSMHRLEQAIAQVLPQL